MRTPGGKKRLARALGYEGGAIGDGAVDLLGQTLGGRHGRQRGQAVGLLLDLGGELLQELVVDTVDDDETFGGVAGLSGVLEPAVTAASTVPSRSSEDAG